MKFMFFIILNCGLVTSELFAQSSGSLTWTQLPSLPATPGVAGPFVGVHHDCLIVAGGANFPGKMPWEGGTKVWYDTVFVLCDRKGEWQTAGRLPRPLGYGVSLSVPEGIVCIGGSDADRHYADCFLLQWVRDAVVITELPSLPDPCANFCGALAGRTICVAGGISAPDSTSAMHTFWTLDLDHPDRGWTSRTPWPGTGRMLAAAGSADTSFYLFGGTSLKPGKDGKAVREYLKDAWQYRNDTWTQLPDLPTPSVAAPGPAPLVKKNLLVLGGDDGSRIDFQPPERHPGFPGRVLAFDTVNSAWTQKGQMPAAHVTTSIVEWHGEFVMPSGEVRPGRRSPEVWTVK